MPEFDELHSEFVRVMADSARATSDDELTLFSDQQDEILWRIIRTPATEQYHINFKFRMLTEILESSLWADGRDTAMVDSIRRDVQAMGDGAASASG